MTPGARFTLTMPFDVLRRITAVATQERRSTSAMTVVLVEEALQARLPKATPRRTGPRAVPTQKENEACLDEMYGQEHPDDDV